jgi:hypothetical protein
MSNESTRTDAYIRRAEMWQQPTLIFLRRAVHEACPDVRETMKEGIPFFDYHGQLAWMAAFASHIAFGLSGDRKGPTGRFGRLTKIGDLPPKPKLLAAIRRAVKRNEARAAQGGARAGRRSAVQDRGLRP